jgi:cardiolipin synthase
MLALLESIWPWLLLIAAVVHFFLVAGFMLWVLMTKTEATSAVAWLLVLAFLPFVGIVAFLLFGNQHVNRPLRRKRVHRATYRDPPAPAGYREATTASVPGEPRLEPTGPKTLGQSLSELAMRFDASSVTQGNHIDLFREGNSAFAAIFESIAAAKSHVHVETYILHDDDLGRRLVTALTEKAKAGVEVRLLYDAIGSYRTPARLLKPLTDAGGKTSLFLPIAILRRRFQVNLRNHRKILVVDGTTGFIGGLNFGDEYVGKSAYFGFWRDTHLRLVGPGAVDLQRVFAEDWDFAAGEHLADEKYYTPIQSQGPHAVQIIDSGPDQEVKAIREVVFAAISKARRRLWIASPYFVPDTGLLDALCLAGYTGVDVRLLGQLKPDKWLPQFAARYYWNQVLRAGVRVFQYRGGMMHAKTVLVDDEFVSIGSANLDNRSMFLNFEANCLIYSPIIAKELEAFLLADFADAVELEPKKYAERALPGRLAENACRLFSPIL